MNRRSLNYTSTFLATVALLLLASSGYAQSAAPGNNVPQPKSATPVVNAKAAPAGGQATPVAAKAAPNSSTDEDADPTIEQIEEAAQPPALESNVFDSGQIVRRRLLYRSTRFELSPFFGLTVNDTFLRNLMPGINMTYHLTNELGISASFAYGVYQWKTDINNNLVEALKKTQRGTKLLNSTQFMKMQFFADLGLSYVPVYGKFSLFGGSMAWDFHLIGGVAIIKQSAIKQCEKSAAGCTEEKDSTIAGIKPGGLLQAGLRLYVNDFISLNFDVRNFIYASADATTGNKDSNEITDRVFVSMGLSFFFPTDVKVSW